MIDGCAAIVPALKKMYQARIVVREGAGEIERLFEAEEKEIGRASYQLKKDRKELIFHIDAPDATSLKAAMNTIAKVLIVWERTEALTKKG